MMPKKPKGGARGNFMRTLAYIFKGHSWGVSCICLSLDWATLYSGSGDNTIKAWDVATGAEIRTFKGHSSIVTCICLSLDGATLYSGSGDDTIKAWDVATGAETRTFKGHSNWVNCICLSLDGATLYSGSGDNTVKAWDVATGAETRTFKGHSGSVYCICLSLDGATLYSGSYDNTIKAWDVATGSETRTFKGHSGSVRCICLSLDGATLYSGSGDKTIKAWDVATGAETRTFKGHSGSVYCICLSLDGATLYSGDRDNTVKAWDVATGAEIRTFKGHSRNVNCICLSLDGATLYSGSLDNTVKAWDVATGAELKTFFYQGQSSISSLLFSKQRNGLFVGEGPDINFLFISPTCSDIAPLWMLENAAQVNKNDSDPEKQFFAVMPLLTKASIYSNEKFFTRLCEADNATGLKKCLFDQEVPSAPCSYTKLLKAAPLDSRECLQLILENVSKSIENHNQVINHTSTSNHQLTRFETDTEFVPYLMEIGQQFPDLLLQFLKSTPLLQTLPVVTLDFDEKASLAKNGMIVFPSMRWSESQFWKQKKKYFVTYDNPPVQTISAQTPYPGFLSQGKSGFLSLLLRHREPELFGTLIVAVVIKHKWDQFGLRMFKQECILYAVSLAFVVAASIVNQSEKTALTAIFGIILALKVYEMWGEAMLWYRGAPGGFGVYLNDSMNLVRMLQMILCVVVATLFFIESEGYIEVLAITVYVKWFALYYYLQPLSGIGPVIRMVTAITLDILNILAVMLIAVIALANTAYLLIQHDPEVTEGFSDFADAMYTTYKILILVDVPDVLELIAPQTFWRLLFVLTSILTSLVMLNLLIARMNDAYERIQDVGEMEERRMKAKLIVRFEATMRSNKPDYFPPFVKVLLQKGENFATLRKNEWAGVLSKVNENIDSVKAAVDTKVDTVDTKVDAVDTKVDAVDTKVDAVDTKVDAVDTKVDAVKTEVDAMNEKIDTLIQLIKQQKQPEEEFGFAGKPHS